MAADQKRYDMRYDITIDRLIFEGIDGHVVDASDIQEIVAAELGRMLSECGPAAAERSSRSVPAVSNGAIRMNPNRGVAHQVGKQIARAVHGEIGHGIKNSRPDHR